MKYIITFLAFLITSFGLYGAAPVVDRVDVRLSFMLVGGGPGNYRVVAPEASAPVLQAEFTPQQRVRTGEFRYRGPLTAQLQRLTAGETVWKPVGEISIPPGVARALVFMTPDRATGGVRAYLLPETGSQVRADEVILFNGTGASLAVKLGDQQVMLPPGGLPPLATTGYRQDIVPLVAAVQTPTGWVKVADGEVQFAPSRRSYILMLPPRKARAPAIQVYSVYEEVDPVKTMVAQR